MTITLNGEAKTLDSGTDLIGLMENYGLNPEATAVQLNDDILEREAFAATTLKDGDCVELIRIVGGG